MINETKFIGLGGGGSKIVDAVCSVNDLANIVFINNNAHEMTALEHYSPLTGIIIRGTGTGRSRPKAVIAITNDQSRVMTHLNMDVGKYTTYVLVFSLDGGFGSGSFKLTAKMIKSLNRKLGYEVAVNVIGIVPKKSTRRINIQNTLEAYVDILDLAASGYIDSYQFIDNNKMMDEQEFNMEVARVIANSYEINNIELDINDAKLVNNTPGYKLVVDLESSDGIYSMQEVVMRSFESSCFLVPTNIGKCMRLGCSVRREDFDKDAIAEMFNIIEFDKEDYNEEMNTLILGGMETPSEYFKELEELLSKEEVAPIEEYRPVIEHKREKARETAQVRSKQAKQLSKRDLRDLFSLLDD